MIDSAIIDRVLIRIPEIESRLSDPATASEPLRFRALIKEHSHLKRVADKAQRYLQLTRSIEENRVMAADDADPDMAALAREELEASETELPLAEKDLRLNLLPPDPDDNRNAVMEIRAGTGGDEAALFAGDLFRMYARYAESKGWKIGVVDASPGEIGGYKEVIFGVQGDGVFGVLRHESGTHRVQRVPQTEAQGRIHTSAATVAVFPEVEEDDDIVIPPEEVRIDIFRSSGPGGQSVNTTDSAVRVTHLPTGVTVQCQDEKSQHRNREKAMMVLKARLLDHKLREEAERQGAARRLQIGSGDRSERIRTYNFPQNRLTDHRINLTLYSLDRIVEGLLEDVIQPLREHAMEARMQAELGV
ncbi:MAG TPA: peptide chain release factor 1 [Verrucomicrobia bacterium]|nr:peptide chain release factor 1 [Verrucomicrobiota bacterium]